MTLMGIQTRYREAGRIRLGDRGGKNNAPRRLSNFRLTSTDRSLVQQVAREYGGEVKTWNEAYEVTITSDRLHIMIPPSAVAQYSQYWEMWTAGACLRRCNGETNLIDATPCVCLQKNGGDMDAQRECKPTTRVGFILQKLGTLGIWRMDTGSYYAAAELPSTIQMLMKAADTFGGPVPAVLRLDPRTSQSRVNGKVQTRKFSVPVIDMSGEFSMEDILGDPTKLAGPTVSHEQLARQPETPAIEAPRVTDAPATDAQRKMLLAGMREANIGDDERHGLIAQITGERTESIKELYKSEVDRLWEGVTARMRDMALNELRARFDDAEAGYSFLREQGLEGAPKEWPHATWLQAYELIRDINAQEDNDESDGSGSGK